MYSGDDYYGDEITSPLAQPTAMNELTILYVECERSDSSLAGTDGDIEYLESWQDRHRYLVTTDVPAVLMNRFDIDDNVLCYEVCQGDEAESHRSA